MIRSSLARSLPLAVSLVFLGAPALAQTGQAPDSSMPSRENSAQKASSLTQSGASALIQAYENALMAHMDTVLGREDSATSRLRIAGEQLAEANRLLNKTLSEAETQPRSAIVPHEMPKGGGGGPGSAEIRTIGPLTALEAMVRSTESNLSPDSTNRLIAAFTMELNRMGRAGGGGGPSTRPVDLAAKMTSIELVGEAYRSAGRAAGAVGLQNWAEAKDGLADASRHLDEAAKAPGHEALKIQLEAMQKAVKQAEGPVDKKSDQAADATMRAVRDMTMSISSLATGEANKLPMD